MNLVQLLINGISYSQTQNGAYALILSEIEEYVYRSIPQYLSQVSGDIYQNPKFNGTDLKRTVLDLR